nr:unnamed protein product [Digitaria exilis]
MPLPGGNGELPHPPHPYPPPLPSLIKLGRAVTAHHVDHFLAVLLRRRRHRLLAALASQAFANAVAPTPRTHLLAASALLDSARPREAAQRLALASCVASRGRRLWDALLRRACAGRGDPRHALELLSAAIEEQIAVLSPSTYRVMVVELCARGEVDGALRVFDIMTRKGCQVDDRVCSSIVSGFSRTGKAAEGLDFYERLRREFSGFEPGLVTLTSVVHALGLEGRIGEMAELMREMECKGMDADAVFYGSIVHGCMSHGFLMEGLWEHRSMLDKGISADVVNYTTVIDGLCREGSVEKVMGFLDAMERCDAKPNLITYTSLVGGFCKRDRLEDAFSIVRRLEQTGVVVDEYVYSILIDSLCKMGDLVKAFSLLAEMENKGIKAGIVTYNAVINGLCKDGDTEKAVEISEGVAADNFTYSTLLHGYIKKDDVTGVMAIKGCLTEAFRLFDYLENSKMLPTMITYAILIGALCREGLYTKGRMEESRGILREMFHCKEVVELINSVGDNIQAESLVDLLSSACDQGRIDEIVTILNEVGHMLLSSSDSSSYNSLAHLSKLQKADDTYDSTSDSGQSPIAYDVSKNSRHRSSEVINEDESLSKASDDTDIDYRNLLEKSFSDDFDSYYTAIASLCSKGEILKANKAIEVMIQNSG